MVQVQSLYFVLHFILGGMMHIKAAFNVCSEIENMFLRIFSCVVARSS